MRFNNTVIFIINENDLRVTRWQQADISGLIVVYPLNFVTAIIIFFVNIGISPDFLIGIKSASNKFLHLINRPDCMYVQLLHILWRNR